MVRPIASMASSLEKYSTCDISDALLKLKHPHGGFIPGPSLWSPERQAGPTKIIGPAYTVKYVPLSEAKEQHVDYHYIDAVPEGAVIFISSPKTVNAVYGGMMSTRAQARGAAGTVVAGRFRDVQEHQNLNYPVFATDVGTASPYETVHINIPIELELEGGITKIAPGDIIVADVNGVVCVPMALLDSILPLLEIGLQADTQVAAALKRGCSFVEASQKYRIR